MLSALPFSAAALHKAGIKSQEALSNDNDELKVTSKVIMNCACQSVSMMKLAAFKVNFVNDCCNESFLNIFLDLPDNIIVDTKLSKNQWASQRKFRITGSRIYEIYTYKGQD
ncbi:hypothetical protein FQR65_LT14044 [Abscondita terminalis]|nr:hypothetical protein FQR65_LT14044 [Abscondita terminalis]